MSIKTVYVSKLGKDYKISEHFTLGETQCKDGTDKVLYSTDLMDKLEALRAYGGFTITINSGYRTASYNKKIGGATSSQHIKGTAADVVVKKDGAVIPAKLICCLAQTLGFKGIGYISANAVHLDMRESGTYRGDERSGYSGNIGNDFYAYFGVNTAQITALKVASATTITCENNVEDEEMTQDQFNQMMATYQQTVAEKAPGNWSASARKFVEENKIFNGDTDGNMHYESSCTREELAQVLYGMANYFEANGGDEALINAIKSITVPLNEIAAK